jgi:Tfp pilus assembly protein PilO
MRRLPLLFLLAVVLIGVAWWFLLIGPKNADIERLESELAAAQEFEQRLRVQIRQLEEIGDRELQYRVALGQLDGLIPEVPRLDEFIEEIHRLSNATGVDLRSLGPALPAPTTTNGELQEFVVMTTIHGEFFQVLGFLFGLNDMERLARVDAIAVNSSQDEFDRTILDVSLQIRVFTLSGVLPELLDPLPPIDSDDGEGAGPDDAEGGGA